MTHVNLEGIFSLVVYVALGQIRWTRIFLTIVELKFKYIVVVQKQIMLS
jgi:hypothetical protein